MSMGFQAVSMRGVSGIAEPLKRVSGKGLGGPTLPKEWVQPSLRI